MLTNCTFVGNSASYGGGLSAWDTMTLTNCTFTGNTATEGGAWYNVATVTATNSILWGNSPDEIAGSPPVVTYSDVQGGFAGQGNIDADPLWLDPASGDLHLGEGSPCIDAGTNDAPNLPPFDFEGDDRILDGDGDGIATVDMGMDEVAISIYLYFPLVCRER